MDYIQIPVISKQYDIYSPDGIRINPSHIHSVPGKISVINEHGTLSVGHIKVCSYIVNEDVEESISLILDDGNGYTRSTHYQFESTSEFQKLKEFLLQSKKSEV